MARRILRYSGLQANGASSILYDANTLRDALDRGVDVALLLGVSGAIALPLLTRRGAKIVTHMDGLEWRRAKWSRPARAFLRWSEALAVRHSDAIIADSPAVAEHLLTRYGARAEVIAYGGDHAARAPARPSPTPAGLPDGYTLALCRIEPENNVRLILQASAAAHAPLVFVGNWDASAYGRDLRARFASVPHLRLLDPVYAPGPLHALRRGAARYVHGHSAGGTNPALVEMMHMGLPVLAFDCIFNRQTTHDQALYFNDAQALTDLLRQPSAANTRLQAVAVEHYTWDRIGAQYFDLFTRLATRPDTTGADRTPETSSGTKPHFMHSGAGLASSTLGARGRHGRVPPVARSTPLAHSLLDALRHLRRKIARIGTNEIWLSAQMITDNNSVAPTTVPRPVAMPMAIR